MVIFIIKVEGGRLKDGSEVKNSYCFCKGREVFSQLLITLASGNATPSSGTPRHVLTHTNINSLIKQETMEGQKWSCAENRQGTARKWSKLGYGGRGRTIEAYGEKETECLLKA